MALSSSDIEQVVETIVHGSEEQYVAELTDTIIREFERGLMYSAEVDLYTLARAYPAKASAILIKYKDQINEEVLDEIQTVLNASVSEDLASLAGIYGVVEAAEYATEHFKEISRQTAIGINQIIERQNVALSQSLQDAWYKVSADAVTAINHGLKPRSQVLADGVVRLMNAGISVIPYQRNGKRTVTNHVDVALRRHITTQVSQAGGRMSLEAMDIYGHDLVITDAHYGARPEHAEWQGLPCSRTGRKLIDGITYPDLVMFTGYGSVTGLKGANCRHMMTAYYPGISRLPDREFKAHEAKFGKTSEEYYQATQRQRELERKIRKTKREIAGLEKAGVGLENPVYVQKRLVLGKQQKTIKQFCKENKLNRLYEREKAYGIGAQPRALKTKRSFAYSTKGHEIMRLESLETFERDYRGYRPDGIEYGMAFDRDGNDLYLEPVVGTERSLEMRLPDGYTNWKTINVAHTHPDQYGGTFSLKDINQFRVHQPLSTSAVANEGTYRLTPISGERHRWVDFEKAYTYEYADIENSHLNTLEAKCLKRGYMATSSEYEEVINKIRKEIHFWLEGHSSDYGFSYAFQHT